ncbi:NADH-quinone oxidoreductase subunit E [Planctomycetaceae bacterium]|nr:NADH-quinone oxidoreductase subunit E [Planctomycetaceae bacterium]
MSEHAACTDNWEEVKATSLRILPPHIVAFIEKNAKTEHPESNLIATLHMVQSHFGFLGQTQMHAVAQLAQIPYATVTGVATFYHYFRLQPRGKHVINVCLGTACYVKGADKLIARLSDDLGVHLGETTKDQMFSLESARCLGTCGLAPVMMVGEQVYGPVTPAEASRILDKYLKEEKAKTAPREEPVAAHVS